jgi:polyphosphate kinase
LPLEELIEAHLDTLFPGMEILDTGVFRVTRDADFEVSDEADDLLRAVEAELRRRRFGEVVRVELDASMPAGLREALTTALGVEPRQVYEIEGMLDLEDLWAVVKLPGFDELRDSPWTPVTQPRLQPGEDGKGDVLGRCAAGTSSSTTRTTRSPRAWSASSSRPWPIRTCWRSR